MGGATGVIGDPSGRTSERTGLPRTVLERNVDGIVSTLKQVFGNAALCYQDMDFHDPLYVYTL